METPSIDGYRHLALRTENVPQQSRGLDEAVHKLTLTLTNEAKKLQPHLDVLKRHLFYGTALEPDAILDKYEALTLPTYPELTAEQQRLLHAILGMLTETLELSDTVLEHIYGGLPLDVVNLFEELGDWNWYGAILLNLYNRELSSVLRDNVAKLKKRYPDGWTQDLAVNRDLEAERRLLEEGGESDERASDTAIRQAIDVLNQSERGRHVKVKLAQFLSEQTMGLDLAGMRAVRRLWREFEAGRRDFVHEILEECVEAKETKNKGKTLMEVFAEEDVANGK
jgi:NTP pyrophosphatase (non-canonical NTP hydrolase)